MSKSRCVLLVIVLLFVLIPFQRTIAENQIDVSPQSVGFSQIEAGDRHTCAITASGASVCWGKNSTRELGTLTPVENYPFPIRPQDMTDTASAITGATNHSCLINAQGTWCWGFGYYGQMGDGEAAQNQTPDQVIGFANPLLISAGGNTTCGVNESGQAYCWGSGGYGEMGNGTSAWINTSPVLVSLLGLEISKISVGYFHVCAVTSAGAAYCWGRDNYGQLGNDPPLADSNLPVLVSGFGSGMEDISAGTLHTCGLTTGGAVWCWGYGEEGYLGNGVLENSPVPVQVTDLTSGVSDIACGNYHSCAVHNGTVKCWGYGGYGALGDGTYDDQYTPVPVVGLGGTAVAVSVGRLHSCALLDNGTIKCWGYNSEGQLGIGVVDPQVYPPQTVPNDIGNVIGGLSYSGDQPTWHEIIVTAHETPDGPPISSFPTSSNNPISIAALLDGTMYGLGSLPDGDYYISAFLDVDDSGSWPPGSTEPIGWYDVDADGNPDPVTITSGAALYGYDIELLDPVVENFTLTITVDPVGSGTVLVSPEQETYGAGEEVTLTATANPGWTFTGWTGDASGLTNPLTLVMNGDKNITANFTQDEYTLTINVDPADSGSVLVEPLEITYNYGEEVSLTAIANPGWTFTGWTGDATGLNNPLTLVMNGDKNIIANFTQDEYTLTVNVDPADSGSVLVEPLEITYNYGEEVSLTATANPGWTFTGWTGDSSGTENPLTFSIVGNTSITANFIEETYKIFLPLILK